MKYFEILGPALLIVGLFVACNEEGEPDDGNAAPSDDAGSEVDADAEQEVRKGERGSSCDSTNDCQDGLSCIVTNDCPIGVACANKSCQPSNFDIMGTGKQCQLVDCATTDDCCGDMPQETPAKCVNRESICSQPTLPGCVVSLCSDNTDCSGGGTCTATCSLDGAACLTTPDCAANTCDTALEPDTCTVSGTDCSISACTTNTCSTPICSCTNPEYDPTAPICSDPDCEGICGFACEEERCVPDTSCDSDTDCAVTAPYCQTGECVECRTSDDCLDEECVGGRCGPECETDTQCSLFEACQANECVFVGCQSDRECVLGASGSDSGQDPRLARCNVEGGIGSCVFPCEIDAQCAPTEVCLDGVCEYIGCETDAECKTIAGLHDQPVPTDERPWTTNAECRAEITPAE